MFVRFHFLDGFLRRLTRCFSARIVRTAIVVLAFLAPPLLQAHGALSLRLAEEWLKSREHPEDPAIHFKLADLYIEHREWEKALAQLDEVERLAPAKFPVDCLRGTAFLLAHKPENALEALDRFVARYPKNPLGHLERPRARRTVGNLTASLVDFRAALEFSPRPEPDLVLEAADAMAASGVREEGLAVLERGLIQLGAVPSLTLRALEFETAAGRYDAALTRMDALQKTAPRPEPWMARRAELLEQAGRIEDARTAWQGLITHLNALPNLERGSHAMSILSEKARQALKALPSAGVPREASRSARAGVPFPTAKAGNSNYDEELERADQEIAAHPVDSTLRFQRAEFNRLAQRWDQARIDCDDADRLAPGKHPTGRIRGELLAGEGEWVDAKVVLNRHLTRQPADSLALAARARVELSLLQTDEALQDFQRSLATSAATTPELYQEAAAAFIKASRFDDAGIVLAAGLAMHPGDPALLVQNLELEITRGRIDPALAQLDALIQSSPRPELLMARRAQLLERVGRSADARDTWQAIIRRIAARPNLERGAVDLAAIDATARSAVAPHPAPAVSTLPLVLTSSTRP